MGLLAHEDPPERLNLEQFERVRELLSRSLFFSADEIETAWRGLVASERAPATELRLEIAAEQDVVRSRVRVLDMAIRLGFHKSDAVKIATVVSELARNIVQYAGVGTIVARATPLGLELRASDNGPGIADPETILAGRYKSQTGMGLGLRGSKRLMDTFEIDSAPGRGTRILAVKWR